MKPTKEMRYSTNMMRSALLLASMTTGTWSVTVLAGDEGQKSMIDEQSFQRADVDGDGQLSQGECQSLQQSHGSTGELSGQGLPATEHQAETMKGFEQLDANADGYLSADELNGDH